MMAILSGRLVGGREVGRKGIGPARSGGGRLLVVLLGRLLVVADFLLRLMVEGGLLDLDKIFFF